MDTTATKPEFTKPMLAEIRAALITQKRRLEDAIPGARGCLSPIKINNLLRYLETTKAALLVVDAMEGV